MKSGNDGTSESRFQIGIRSGRKAFRPYTLSLDDRGHHRPEARLQRHADVQRLVGILTLCGDGRTADRGPAHANAIDPDLERARHLQASDDVRIGPGQPDPEVVLAIHWKVVSDGDTAS